MANDTIKTKIAESYIEGMEKTGTKFANERIKKIARIVLENQISDFEKNTNITSEVLAESILNEGTTNIASADIAKFGEIYLPIAAKVIPSLVINNMVGVQPMTQPNGFVYAMRASYSRSPYDQAQDAGSVFAARGAKYSNTQIINVADATNITANTNWINVAAANNLVAKGFVLYKEGSILLVKVAQGDAGGGVTYRNFAVGDDIDTGTAITDNYAATETSVSAIYKNEIAQAAGILKNYSGPVDTDDGLYQRSVGQVTIRVERTSVEARTRQLFAEYPIEAEQDLRAVHGKDLRSELSEITAGEIINELNKEFIDDIQTAGAVGGTTTFDLDTADARWEIEKFRSLFVRIVKNANQIAMSTRLGPGNYIIGSPNVITALTQLDGFQAAPVTTGPMASVSRIGGEWYVGTIAGMFDIYRDMFATSEYATIGRKGTNEWDAGLFFLPYIPLQFISGQTDSNLQPKMKFMTRYGKVTNVLNDTDTVADPRYYRLINVFNLFT